MNKISINISLYIFHNINHFQYFFIDVIFKRKFTDYSGRYT